MEPGASVEALARFFDERSIEMSGASLDVFLEVAVAFYAEVPATGLLDGDSDWLMFQHGVVAWGSDEMFQIGVTRQFFTAAERADDRPEISQLRCALIYQPTPALRAVPATTRWCRSHAELPDFRAAILANEAYRLALGEAPDFQSIEWLPL